MNAAAAEPTSEGGIPARAYPVTARAPGKCILFGEHAVVHGRPELLLAIDLYTQVSAHRAEAWSLNHRTAPVRENPYLARSIADWGPPDRPLALTTASRLPRASGLGSSAAFVAAVLAVAAAGTGGCGRAELARRCYLTERGAQGVGSPGDTAAAVGGGILSINGGRGPLRWTHSDGGRSWSVRSVPDPGWTWVLGYSGIPHDTARTVRAVGERLAQPDGEELLERFAAVATEGIEAVVAEDRDRVGALLEENHRLLVEVGVSHPRLEELRSAVRPACVGAKITGAGAGGSIVALPRPGRELEAIRRIARAGAVAYGVRVAPEGVTLLEAPRPAGETLVESPEGD
ncbi:MAG: mevalonate kinase family protein [Thermoplasmata archaeon]